MENIHLTSVGLSEDVAEFSAATKLGCPRVKRSNLKYEFRTLKQKILSTGSMLLITIPKSYNFKSQYLLKEAFASALPQENSPYFKVLNSYFELTPRYVCHSDCIEMITTISM